MNKVKTSVDFDRLREELPSRYAIIMAEKFNCSRSKVWKVASGKRNDVRILQALLDLAKKEKKLKESAAKTSNKL